MRSRGNANYWHKITQGFPPECLNCPTPSHCRSEPEGTAGYCRTAVEGPVARTVAFNLAMRYCHRAVRADVPNTDAGASGQQEAPTLFCGRNPNVAAELNFKSLLLRRRCVCPAPVGRQGSCPTVRTKRSTS